MNATQSSIEILPTVQREAKHTILFLAANPCGTDQLALDREAKVIQEELQRCGCRDSLEFVTRWAVEPMDLLRELRRLKPTVVHFSGHGMNGAPRDGADLSPNAGPTVGSLNDDEREGLFFHGPDGGPKFVSTAALDETFRAAGASVRLVVLSACYSEAQANALVAHVACVVGMRRSSRVAATRAFAIGFYGGLGEGESIAAAFKQGIAAIHLQRPIDDNTPRNVSSSATEECVLLPRLLALPGVDSDNLYVVPRSNTKVRCTIVIKAKLKNFDAIVIARVREQLRLLTGDVSLEIVEVQEGSVKLTISISPDAAMQLKEWNGDGKLDSLCGFGVLSIGSDGIAAEEPEAPGAGRAAMWIRERVRQVAIHTRVGVADFVGSRLSGAKLSKINLAKADFFAADLAMSNLAMANLTGANLQWADLTAASLAMAKLTEANLDKANLDRANLDKASLAGASLQGANLQGANLQGTNLVGADLTEASLVSANLVGANLTEASLVSANLVGTSFQRAKLTEANLALANLGEANLARANLARANLARANLARANLQGANLQGANFEGANLQGANLAGVDLEGANLEGGNLEGVSLAGAHLKGAHLKGTNLKGANLKGTNLVGASLAEAHYNEATHWPPGFVPPTNAAKA